ncbi:MAG: DUF5916 domain-containing protein [Saprospiraceae bacterium]
MRISIALLLLITSFNIWAQKKNANFKYYIKPATSAIKVDGNGNDEAWKSTDVATDFYMVLPMDTSKAKGRTDCRMAYDEKNIYLLVEAYHMIDKKIMVESLKRDFSFGKNDNFLLFMDPFDDRTNGFSFGSNAAGAQWDGTMYDGGKVDLSWENKWTGVTKNYDDKWVFEAAIPFKSIRYKKGITEWGINFSRLDIRTTEKSSWTPIPRIFPTASLAYTGTLVWDKAPPDAGQNISIIPYVLAGTSKDFANNKAGTFRKDIGADAKIALSSSLNLDLTVNPDFSQVEVDQQVTNLDRFELFFPERRQFFLENGDLFANIGTGTMRPFFSRRIGLGIPIDFGVRLSGKLDQNWRIGVLDMQTRKNESQPGYNFGMIALQRKLFSRSNITVFGINKQAFNYEELSPVVKQNNNQFNRNLGLEYNLASANNRWTGKFNVVHSFDTKKSRNAWAHVGNIGYNSRKFSGQWQQEYVSNDFTAEVGYVPRKNYWKISPTASYLFYTGPQSKILTHGPSLGVFSYFTPSLKTTDRTVYFQYSFSLRTQAKLGLWMADDWVQLLQPFDPTNTNKPFLTVGSKHHWNSTGGDFTSAPQKLFTWAASYRIGGYYQNGSRTNITTELGYRFQPYIKLALASSYTNIDLPAPWNKSIFWLVGPRVDVTFTNKLFLTSFMQYNEQIKNVNINTRLQWRFAPASDIYLVYTDNYLPSPWNVKNRALVFKMNYWWNL